MNDYEMMNQRVEELRDKLRSLQDDEYVIQVRKSCVLEDLLKLRRQITQADKTAKLVLGNR